MVTKTDEKRVYVTPVMKSHIYETRRVLCSSDEYTETGTVDEDMD